MESDLSEKVLRRRWKYLAASVLAAVLIGLACGLCESSMNAACMKVANAILLLLPTM